VHADLRRIRLAEFLALGSGVLLAVSLFLPWYSVSGAARESAWQAFTISEIPLAGAAIAALALFIVTLVQRSPSLPVAVAVWTTLLGLVAVGVATARAIALPSLATDRCYGLWLGLAGAVGVLVAAWMSMRDERPFRGLPFAAHPPAGQ
jgi:hypothetical protein